MLLIFCFPTYFFFFYFALRHKGLNHTWSHFMTLKFLLKKLIIFVIIYHYTFLIFTLLHKSKIIILFKEPSEVHKLS